MFGDVFAIFSCLRGPLAQILVEHTLSFKMSTQTSKSSEIRKMWYYHKNMLNMLKLKTSPNHSKSLILGSGDSFSSNFNIFEKNNSNCSMLQAVTCKFSEMCPFSAPVNFFSFWHYIPLDNHWIDHSYQFWPPNPCTRHVAAPQKKNSRFLNLQENHKLQKFS